MHILSYINGLTHRLYLCDEKGVIIRRVQLKELPLNYPIKTVTV